MAGTKIKAVINGKTISLSEAAFKVAKRFYGATSEEELRLSKPVELSKPLIKPTMKPVIIKPPLKEVPEVKVPEVTEGDPATVKVKASVPDVTGDPVTEAPKAVVKKAPVKRKKK
jgi:hypothetical protein